MRPTRTSKTLEIARRRLDRLKSIVPAPNFGTGFTLEDFEAGIEQLAAMETAYNTMVSGADAKLSEIKVHEKQLRDMRERILTAIAFIYGKDSDEYVAAGGIRKSERKRPRSRQGSSPPAVEN